MVVPLACMNVKKEKRYGGVQGKEERKKEMSGGQTEVCQFLLMTSSHNILASPYDLSFRPERDSGFRSTPPPPLCSSRKQCRGE